MRLTSAIFFFWLLSITTLVAGRHFTLTTYSGKNCTGKPLTVRAVQALPQRDGSNGARCARVARLAKSVHISTFKNANGIAAWYNFHHGKRCASSPQRGAFMRFGDGCYDVAGSWIRSVWGGAIDEDIFYHYVEEEAELGRKVKLSDVIDEDVGRREGVQDTTAGGDHGYPIMIGD